MFVVVMKNRKFDASCVLGFNWCIYVHLELYQLSASFVFFTFNWIRSSVKSYVQTDVHTNIYVSTNTGKLTGIDISTNINILHK